MSSSAILDRQGLQSVEQSIRKRIRSNQCRIHCSLPFQSQAGFASASTVGTDSSGGKAVSGGTSSSQQADYITAITVEATNGQFENLVSTQFTTENASISTALIQTATIAQINGDVNFNAAAISNVNIDSGTIDGVVIGAEVPPDATFDDLQANNSFTLLGASGTPCVTYTAATETFTICGDLVVEGNSTTIQSETVVVEDVTIRLGNTAPLGDDGKDRGVEFGYHTGTTFAMGFMGWDNSEDKFTLLTSATNNNEVYDGTLGSLMLDTLCANQIQGVSGNITIGTTGDYTLSPTENLIFQPGENIIIPDETQILFGSSSCIYSSGEDLIICTPNDLIMDVSGSINILTNTTLEFGSTSFNVYGNGSDLVVTSENDVVFDANCIALGITKDCTICKNNGNLEITNGGDIGGITIDAPENLLLNISGSIIVPTDTPIEFGNAANTISSDGTDLLLESNGYIILDAPECIAIGSELDCFICKEDGDLKIKNEGVDGNFEFITNENFVLNISGSVQVQDSTPIEFGSSGNNIYNNGNDLVLSAMDDILFDTDCLVLGVTKDCMICKDNGNLQIINGGTTGNISIDTSQDLLLNVSGSIEVPANTQIEFGSSGFNIYGDNTNLIISSTDTVFVDACLAIGDLSTKICNIGDQLVFQGTSGIVFNSNDIDIPIVKEYCRISYKECDIDGDYDVCEVISKRELLSGLPHWYWQTDTEASGNIIYAYDLNQHVRDITTKGLKLTGVYFWFDISGDAINSVSSTVTKSTINPLSPGPPSLSSVTVDNSTLNTNTAIGTYYTKVDVTSTNYYNSHENLTIELTINKKTNSIIKFYGMQLEFDKKYF